MAAGSGKDKKPCLICGETHTVPTMLTVLGWLANGKDLFKVREDLVKCIDYCNKLKNTIDLIDDDTIQRHSRKQA